ncbi:nicotinate phosphoribosyltransferase [Anaerovibrio lipolyticus DSM 3074]|uniref:nicotinate phosphoribosyltransferase n=2 Tax=Anaerovibrio lipolyticus TaxID=82374 RepID=A0A0B2JZP3_9FIRM|nr:nicotinate phosphoribosyltransferase [Anaerovibrio lipolyticus]KHM52188.1 quinolinate phosphoribosyl transferase [Anaerovibrio lipolyticus]SHI35008.1 nicotinate phosphoribosyltransferase [Anaerovibrio lipolyticus DSM 3074]
MTKKRLNPESFDFPVDEIKSGLYSDIYFLRTQEILNHADYHPTVTMQIFQRDYATLCGIDEAIALIKRCAYHPEKIKLRALHDGDKIEPWETVMTIEGDLADFSHLETVYLGIIARQTKVATNCAKAVEAANGKPVLFFPSRFDHYAVQKGDGYAAKIGGMTNVSTPANAISWGIEAAGTIPHALIAACEGDTLKATEMFDKYIDPKIGRVALVDFNNDCVGTSLKVARALGDKLYGVRLDTSDKMVDKSLIGQMGHFKPTGVNEQLVRNVREALDAEGFNHVKIMVSGGFNPERIRLFETNNVPVDVYAVGSNIFATNADFTADIVLVNGKPCAKAGRAYSDNPRLEDVD